MRYDPRQRQGQGRPLALEAARELESLGYGALWFGETPMGKEAFAHAGLLLGATERVAVGTGIMNIWLREPSAARNGAATLAEGRIEPLGSEHPFGRQQ